MNAEVTSLQAEYDELQNLFRGLEYRYSFINDDDVLEAFSLMRESSALLANYEQLSAQAYAIVATYERLAKATEARRSCELSPKPTDGARRACFDEEVIKAWNEYASIVKIQKYIDTNARFLSRMYFDSKMLVENCYRKERKPVGDNKVVGRV